MQNIIPQIISVDSGRIYGILRKPTGSKKIFVVLPASSGTRIGPQRIFIELAHALYNIGISTICVDLPSLGDSYSKKKFKLEGDFFNRLTEKYEYYIQLIIDDISNRFDFNEINIMSISYGCIPCYSYAIKNDVKHLVLLSPDHIIGSIKKINRKNIKSYYYRLFQKRTWVKILKFHVNYNQIYKNIFNRKHRQQQIRADVNMKNKELNVLSLFGEKDEKMDTFIKHWETKTLMHGIRQYQYKIVKNSDHSFFGWQFKRDVEKCIVDWLVDKEAISILNENE